MFTFVIRVGVKLLRCRLFMIIFSPDAKNFARCYELGNFECV